MQHLILSFLVAILLYNIFRSASVHFWKLLQASGTSHNKWLTRCALRLRYGARSCPSPFGRFGHARIGGGYKTGVPNSGRRQIEPAARLRVAWTLCAIESSLRFWEFGSQKTGAWEKSICLSWKWHFALIAIDSECDWKSALILEWRNAPPKQMPDSKAHNTGWPAQLSAALRLRSCTFACGNPGHGEIWGRYKVAMPGAVRRHMTPSVSQSAWLEFPCGIYFKKQKRSRAALSVAAWYCHNTLCLPARRASRQVAWTLCAISSFDFAVIYPGVRARKEGRKSFDHYFNIQNSFLEIKKEEERELDFSITSRTYYWVFS